MQSTPIDAGEELWRLPLAQLSDSAAPTGAFAHSFGMETALEDALVTDEATCEAWMLHYIAGALTLSDALGVRLADEALTRGDHEAFMSVCRQLVAALAPSEIRQASRTIGARMLCIAADGFPGPAVVAYEAAIRRGEVFGHPAMAMAACGHDHAAPWRATALTSLHGAVTSLVGVAVRAIPLGQNAGQRVLAHLNPALRAAVRRASGAHPDELGAASPALEIAQMRHRWQHSRMFMS
jgi:urease accessory protein